MLMKKLFTLVAGLAAALAMQAQSDFPLQFADKDGNIIADGTTLTLTETITDDFGDVQLPTHLYVKNITDGDIQGGGTYTITSIGSGTFQTCFPQNCAQQTRPGTYTTESGNLAAGQLKYMQTEWLPTKEGTAAVTYQLLTFKKNVITQKWTKDKSGPTVTLQFNYGTSSAVASLPSSQPDGQVSYYDLQGRQVFQPRHGVFVKKTLLSDGTQQVQKVRIR